MDLSCWMTELDESLVQAPFINLAIPGSHDSLTYTIKPTNRLSPDADPPILHFLNKIFGPVVRRFMFHWCVTQKLNVTQQLQLGIRYFDVRLATMNGDKNFYIVHGLYGDSIDKPLVEIADYIKNNQGEVCIVDLQHFYEFSSEDHIRLSLLLLKIFDGILCPIPEDVSALALHDMRVKNQRVIVVYRCDEVKEDLLWRSNLLPTPWPNTMSPSYLVNFLSNGLSKRGGRLAYVSQCVLTPSRFTVLFTPWAGLHSRCAMPAAQVILPWLKSLSECTGCPPLNIAISDFVNDSNDAFTRSVIALNFSDKLKSFQK